MGIKDRLNEIASEYEDELANLRQDKDEAVAQASKLEQDLADLQEKYQQLEQERDETATRLEAAPKSAEDFEEYHVVQNQLAQVGERLEQANYELLELQETYDSAQTELKDIRTKFEGLEKTRSELEQRICKVEEKWRKEGKRSDELQKELDEKSNYMSPESFEKATKVLEDAVSERDAIIAKKNEKITEDEKKIEALTNALNRYEACMKPEEKYVHTLAGQKDVRSSSIFESFQSRDKTIDQIFAGDTNIIEVTKDMLTRESEFNKQSIAYFVITYLDTLCMKMVDTCKGDDAEIFAELLAYVPLKDNHQKLEYSPERKYELMKMFALTTTYSQCLAGAAGQCIQKAKRR